MTAKSKSRASRTASSLHELADAHRSAAEDRFVALVRQERMRSFIGRVADAPEDELRAAFGLVLHAVRETARITASDGAGNQRVDATMARLSPAAAAELDALRMLSMQLVDVGETQPDETPALRPRKRPVGH